MVATTLEFINSLVVMEEEGVVITQQLAFNGLVEALSSTIYHAEKRVRKLSVMVLTNLAKSREDSIQSRVTERDLFLSVVNVLQGCQDEEVLLELTFLFHNWLFLCSEHLTKELIQDSKLSTLVQNKVLQLDK